MQWRNDELAIQVLESIGLQWHRETVPLSSIDRAKSRLNRARVQPIDEVLVTSYRQAMRDGDVFPEVVARRLGPAHKLILAGGNHRLEAFEALHPEGNIQVLVAECSDMEFDAACKALNAVGGKTSTDEQKIDQAAELVTAYGISINMAARLMRCPTEGVRVELRSQVVQAIAAKNDISLKGWCRTPLSALAAISDHEPVLVTILKLARGRPLAILESKQLRRCVDEAKSDVAKTEAARLWFESRPKLPRKRVMAAPVRTALSHNTTGMETALAKVHTLTQSQMSIDELKDLVRRWKSITSKLTQMLANGSVL